MTLVERLAEKWGNSIAHLDERKDALWWIKEIALEMEVESRRKERGLSGRGSIGYSARWLRAQAGAASEGGEDG
jgi:hypothetical protein